MSTSGSNNPQIPEVEICSCDKIMVEMLHMTPDENVGRKKIVCPAGWNGCGFFQWMEPPLETRAVKVIQDLIREKSDLAFDNMMEKCKIYEKYSKKVREIKEMAKANAEAIEQVPTEPEDDSEE